jgi:hypothetical protein
MIWCKHCQWGKVGSSSTYSSGAGIDDSHVLLHTLPEQTVTYSPAIDPSRCVPRDTVVLLQVQQLLRLQRPGWPPHRVLRPMCSYFRQEPFV